MQLFYRNVPVLANSVKVATIPKSDSITNAPLKNLYIFETPVGLRRPGFSKESRQLAFFSPRTSARRFQIASGALERLASVASAARKSRRQVTRVDGNGARQLHLRVRARHGRLSDERPHGAVSFGCSREKTARRAPPPLFAPQRQLLSCAPAVGRRLTDGRCVTRHEDPSLKK